MFSESYRPNTLDEIIGHANAKSALRKYLSSDFKGCIFLVGSPGIGKTTLTLCAAKTLGFDPIEINASKSLRSFNDVVHLRDSCRGAVNIQSFLVGSPTRKSCIILDELDGSDPHAQTKIMDWILEPTRCVPILCTGNDVPSIFKKNGINIVNCVPPDPSELTKLFKYSPDLSLQLKKCNNDVRKMLNTFQYGESYVLPKYVLPPTGSSPETAFLVRQKMFDLPNPLEYLVDKPGKLCLHQTMYEYRHCDKHGRKTVVDNLPQKSHPDKSHTKLEMLLEQMALIHDQSEQQSALPVPDP
jgi:hypothetical protein